MTTLRQVVDALAAEGSISSERHADISTLYRGENTDSFTPWYMRALLGFSAWVAAILLLLFLFGMNAVDNEKSALLLGIILCGGAITARHLAPSNDFVNQLTLALSLTGQVLFIGGTGLLAESVTIAAIAAVVLETILMALYPDQIHRFLSVLVIVGSIAVAVFDIEIKLALHGLITITAFGVMLLWEHETSLTAARAEELARPVAYGLTISLFGLIVVHLFDDSAIGYWWLSAIGLLLVLVIELYRLMQEYRVPVDGKLAAVLGGGLLLTGLAAIHTPGLLAALLVLLLGFRRGNLVLRGLATVFLVVFIASFYYTLSLTLLLKSLSLIGSGLILFGVRSAAKRLMMPREVSL